MENKKSINSIEEIWRYKCSEIEKMVDQNIIRKDNIDGKTNKIEGNKDNNIEHYEVLTDETYYWVSAVNLKKICSEIKIEELSKFDFVEDNDVIRGEKYYVVSKDFLHFVYNNTNNPKYKPIFSLLKTIGYREKFDDYEYDGKDGKDGNNEELQLIPAYEEEQSIELSM